MHLHGLRTPTASCAVPDVHWVAFIPLLASGTDEETILAKDRDVAADALRHGTDWAFDAGSAEILHIIHK